MTELSSLILADVIDDAVRHKLARGIRRRGIRGLRNRGIISVVARCTHELGPLTGVEVGIKWGHLSRMMLNNCPDLKQLTMVDPWSVYPPDHADRLKWSYARRTQKRWDGMASGVLVKMRPYGNRARVLRMASVVAAAQLRAFDERPFFVYLDARHQYPDVLEDCLAWWPVVAPGGFISGDDYYPADNPRRSQTGVGQAADEFASRVGLSVLHLHRNWFVQKPCE